jgi:hypothetical protein
MAITKGDIIMDAFEEIRISGLTIQASPNENERGLNKLESMAAEWESRNICAGYNFTEQPDPSDPSNIQLSAKQAFVTNLATRMITSFGKEMPNVLAVQAMQSLSGLSSAVAMIRQVQAPNRMPRGSGNTLRYNRWQKFNQPAVLAPQNCTTETLLIGNVNDFFADWTQYLSSTEDLASYTLSASSGVEVLTQSLASPRVNFRAKGVSLTTIDAEESFATVSITVTTTDGRVDTKVINFKLLRVNYA